MAQSYQVGPLLELAFKWQSILHRFTNAVTEGCIAVHFWTAATDGEEDQWMAVARKGPADVGNLVWFVEWNNSCTLHRGCADQSRSGEGSVSEALNSSANDLWQIWSPSEPPNTVMANLRHSCQRWHTKAFCVTCQPTRIPAYTEYGIKACVPEPPHTLLDTWNFGLLKGRGTLGIWSF